MANNDVSSAQASDLDGEGTLVLRHIDALPTEYRAGLGRELSAASAGATPWVVATARTGRGQIGQDLLRHFPSSVTVPPLRHHIDDLDELVPFLLLQPAQCPNELVAAYRSVPRASGGGPMGLKQRRCGRIRD